MMLPIKFGRLLNVRRVHQHVLNDEVELAQCGGCLGHLHHLILKKEHHVIDELDCDLPVDTQHRSVDVDPLTCPQGYSHRRLHQSESRIRRLMSISCITSLDFSSSRRSASLRT